MKTMTILTVLVLCASGAFAATTLQTTDDGTSPSPSATAAEATADAGQLCPSPDALPSVGIAPAPAPQAINQCKIDCREDYGACLISTPSYICDAIYRNCLANC